MEGTVKNIWPLLVGLLVFCQFSAVPFASAQVAAQAVYHVHFAKAALGKGAQEGDYLKKQNPSAIQGHFLVLRHQSGDDWDYAVIEHVGAKTTIDAEEEPPAAAGELAAWHDDTFFSGPSWPEFARAMGLDDANKSAGSVYEVSVYRAAPGHRDELEKYLAQPLDGDKTVAGYILMHHLAGGSWHFLTIARYRSWQDFATSEKTSAPDTLNPNGGWIGVRNHSSYHADTIADRIAP